MGLLDSLRDALTTKAPNEKTEFVFTNFNKNNLFEGLIGKSRNYLDQYILYTYKCIDIISDQVAEKEPVFKKQTNENFEILLNEPILNDLMLFNPYLSYQDAVKLLETHIRLTGIGAWFISREDLSPGHQKAEFYPLDPTKLDIKTDNLGLVDYFQYEDGDGNQVNLDKDNVLYFRYPSHKNWLEGYSQIEAIQFIHNAYSYGSQHNMNTFANGARPDFMIMFDGISEKQREAVEAQLSERYGGVKNARRAGVLNKMAQILEITKTNKDLDYVEGMKMLRQDVMAMFGVPEALVFPSATNSNTKESLKIFQKLTVKPALKKILSVYNDQLIQKYYLTNRYEQIKDLYFDFENIVDVDRKEVSEITKMQFEAGIITRNEARAMLELEADEELGDQYFINNNENDLENTITEIKSLHKKSINDITKLVSQSQEIPNEAINQKQLEEQAIQLEREFRPYVNTYFEAQAQRLLENYGEKLPTLKNAFDLEKEIELAKKHFEPIYTSVSSEVNQEVNVEIRQKLFKTNNKAFLTYKDKGLTQEALDLIDQRMQFFAKEVNKVTQKQLKKAIADAVKNNLTSRQLQQKVADIFNKYIDGAKNIEVLTKYGVYIEKVGVTTEGGAVISSDNRFDAMLERITEQLQGDEQRQALTALKGVIDPEDPAGARVNTLLTNVYKISEKDAITDYRAAKIARTEANTVRNFVLREQYETNEFVKGMKWNSILQPTVTRPEHLKAHGQVIPKGGTFVVGGQRLKYPGDSSMGASGWNTVSCRCRVTAEV